MGIEKAVALKPPDWEYGFRYGTIHTTSQEGVWQTAVDLTFKRGTLYVRHCGSGNSKTLLRVTIDGNVCVLDEIWKAAARWWLLDFNKSIKVEHRCNYTATGSRVELAYFNYDKDGSCP